MVVECIVEWSSTANGPILHMYLMYQTYVEVNLCVAVTLQVLSCLQNQLMRFMLDE